MLCIHDRIYEYRDKAGKYLAKVLAGHIDNPQIPSMVGPNGKVHNHPIGKLELFHDYFTKLYSSFPPKAIISHF